ncbi:MAG: peptidoglycan DD-metalloendopeptidase family protein [Pseudomonadota bacterium]
MSRWPLAALLLAGLMALAVQPAAANEDDYQALQAARQRVEAVDESLRTAQERLDALLDESREISEQIEGLQSESVVAAVEIRQHEHDLQLLENELARWELQEATERRAFEQENETLAGLLGVLARLARLPAEPLILGDGDPNDQVRTALAARSVITEVEARTVELRNRLDRLTRVRAQLQQRSADTERARRTLDARITALNGIIETRRAMLRTAGARSDEAQKRVEDLGAEAEIVAQFLRTLETEVVRRAAIAGLDPPIASLPTVAALPAIGRPPIDPEQAAAIAALERARPPPTGSFPDMQAVAGPTLSDMVKQFAPEEPARSPLARILALAIPQQPEETGGTPEDVGVAALAPPPEPAEVPTQEGGTPLPAERPRVEQTPPSTAALDILTPVSGDIALGFGDQDAFGQVHKGLTIKATPDLPVLSPLEGTVRFAGPFQEYGRLLIVEHGDGYHSLIAGLGRIDVTAGQQVLTGEPIGATPAPQTAGTSTVDIYFEFRQDGVPINPIRGLTMARQRGEG